MNVLIMGITGFIGSNLAIKLIEEGYNSGDQSGKGVE